MPSHEDILLDYLLKALWFSLLNVTCYLFITYLNICIKGHFVLFWFITPLKTLVKTIKLHPNL